MTKPKKTNGDRDPNGRYRPGHSQPGPGRPRFAVEAQYTGIVGDVVTPDEWRAVVERALADAKAGDATARAWLAKYVTGDPPLHRLFSLAVDAERGRSVDDAIRDSATAADVGERAARAETERARLLTDALERFNP